MIAAQLRGSMLMLPLSVPSLRSADTTALLQAVHLSNPGAAISRCAAGGEGGGERAGQEDKGGGETGGYDVVVGTWQFGTRNGVKPASTRTIVGEEPANLVRERSERSGRPGAAAAASEVA